MSIEFRMPSLGADMESGTLVEWKMKPGDVVKRGDVVAVVETDKGAIDVEIYDSGTVEKLIVEPGTKVPVGEVLALLAGESKSEGATESPSLPLGDDYTDVAGRATHRAVAERVGERGISHVSVASPPSPQPSPVKGNGVRGRQKISPAARARAHQLNVSLESIHGTGPGGVVTLQDVEAASTKPKLTPAETMRAVIAAAMARSKREIPHYYLSTDVDYNAVAIWLAKRNAELPIEQRMLPVVPLLRAIVLALQAFPDFNGYYKDNAFQSSTIIHLGVAIAQRGGGLIAPAILDAHEQSLPQLTKYLGDLVTRVRSGRLKNRELSDGTFTLTSLGDGGVDAVFPVIYPPQVAILGAGTVRERPTAINGKIEARSIITLSLAADHRVSNGRSGAQFLARIRDLLQSPEKL